LRQTLNKHEDIKRESIKYFYFIKPFTLVFNLFVDLHNFLRFVLNFP